MRRHWFGGWFLQLTIAHLPIPVPQRPIAAHDRPPLSVLENAGNPTWLINDDSQPAFAA